MTETMKTINPYRLVLQFLVRRIRWDLDWRSWSSRRALARLKDSHAGKKAVILCNGPSLLKTDFHEISETGVFSFGLNKINLLFDTTSFRPDCVVSVNGHVIAQNQVFFNETALPIFLDWTARRIVKKRSNVIFLHSIYFPEFAEDCSLSVFQGFTVTYVAMQLAYHLGFRAVALVGCDHSFAQKGRPNEAVIAGIHDPSHFHPKYFADGMTWNLPDLRSSELYYLLARHRYEENGRKLYNCTVGGELEVLPRCSLEQYLAD
jgi:hypothetical protein